MAILHNQRDTVTADTPGIYLAPGFDTSVSIRKVNILNLAWLKTR